MAVHAILRTEGTVAILRTEGTVAMRAILRTEGTVAMHAILRTEGTPIQASASVACTDSDENPGALVTSGVYGDCGLCSADADSDVGN